MTSGPGAASTAFAFVDGALDRAEHLRLDPARLQALWPSARLLLIDAQGQALGDADGLHFAALPGPAGTLDARAVFLGLHGDEPWFAVPVDEAVLDASAARIDLRSAAASWRPWQATAFAQARAVMHWGSRHRHCSVCGVALVYERAGWDLSFLRQEPTSPVVRAGATLSPLIPLDSNHNPSDAKLDENRVHLVGRYAQETGWGEFSALAAWSHSEQDLVRGFLGENFDAPSGNNAHGYRQDRSIDDYYLDAHWDHVFSEQHRLVFGADYLGGQGDQGSKNFEYRVALSGIGAPSSGSRPVDEITHTDDGRDFFGLYADWQYTPNEDFRLDAGVRLNHTNEDRDTRLTDTTLATTEEGSDSRDVTRLSGALGASYRLWDDGRDALSTYANYKNTFKPAVIDFGPEADPEILEPEYASSGEVGLRGTLAGQRLSWDLSAFYMDFRNFVVPSSVDGLPGLDNAGTLHLRGAELEADLAITPEFRVLGRYAYHDTRLARRLCAPVRQRTRQLQGNRHESTPAPASGSTWTSGSRIDARDLADARSPGP